jgi:hypothetical protein
MESSKSLAWLYYFSFMWEQFRSRQSTSRRCTCLLIKKKKREAVWTDVFMEKLYTGLIDHPGGQVPRKCLKIKFAAGHVIMLSCFTWIKSRAIPTKHRLWPIPRPMQELAKTKTTSQYTTLTNHHADGQLKKYMYASTSLPRVAMTTNYFDYGQFHRYDWRNHYFWLSTATPSTPCDLATQ